MITKNFKPTKKHKMWHDELAVMGCLFSSTHAEIDHLLGASAKQDGIWIGQWCVAPLSPYWHRTGPCNRTNKRDILRNNFCSKMGRGVKKNLELELFMWTCANYVQTYQSNLPFDMTVMSAILKYCRSQ